LAGFIIRMMQIMLGPMDLNVIEMDEYMLLRVLEFKCLTNWEE